jgi:protein-disulfide isomerase
MLNSLATRALTLLLITGLTTASPDTSASSTAPGTLATSAASAVPASSAAPGSPATSAASAAPGAPSAHVTSVASAASRSDHDDLTALKDQVAQLNTQQQQILASLDELKKMMRGPTPPALKPPPTMSLAGEVYQGEPSAKVAIIEYADFQCPFCRKFESQVYPTLRDSYIRTGKLKYYHRDMPLPFHQGAMPAARAVHCASEQGKFWEMHDSLLGDAASLTPADIDQRAGQLGMNVPKLDQCISSDRFADIIQRSINEATAMQVSGTPTFIIGTLDTNGNVMSVKKTVVGASPFEAFQAAIDPLLAAVN